MLGRRLGGDKSEAVLHKQRYVQIHRINRSRTHTTEIKYEVHIYLCIMSRMRYLWNIDHEAMSVKKSYSSIGKTHIKTIILE